MQVPLEISFHGLPSSEWLEEAIREHAAKLEKLYPRCRVVVEALHKQHRTGNVYEVHIELRLPGGELVVSREPHRAKEKYADPDMHQSLRDAFAAAERQLLDYKRRQAGELKPHQPLFQGQIAQLYTDEEHGFILTNEGSQLYFHRNGVIAPISPS